MSETALMKNIRCALNKTGRVRVVRNQVAKGWFSRTQGGAEAWYMTFGLGLGSPDLVGTLRGGRCFCVEVKSSTGRVEEDQTRWHKSARAWGIFVCVARSEKEALDALARAEAGGIE